MVEDEEVGTAEGEMVEEEDEDEEVEEIGTEGDEDEEVEEIGTEGDEDEEVEEIGIEGDEDEEVEETGTEGDEDEEVEEIGTEVDDLMIDEGGVKLKIALDEFKRSVTNMSASTLKDCCDVFSPTDCRTADVYFMISFFAGSLSR